MPKRKGGGLYEHRIELEELNRRSKRAVFQEAYPTIPQPSQETLVARMLERHDLLKVFRRVDLEWFYRGIQKQTKEEKPMVEKVGLGGTEARIRPAQLLI